MEAGSQGHEYIWSTQGEKKRKKNPCRGSSGPADQASVGSPGFL